MIAVRAGGVKPPLGKTAPPPPRRIPFAFRADPVALDGLGLPTRARAAFVLILDNAKDRAWKCRLSNATMGRVLGCCTMTIKRALATLEAAGLIRRETAAGGRIRTAIVVTWDGVEQPCSAGRPALEHARSGGGTPASRGVEHSGPTDHPGPIHTEIPDAARSPLGGEGDAASRVATGPEAAAYLRACVEAGRRGGPMPPPPAATDHVADAGETVAPPAKSCSSFPMSSPPPRPAPTPATIPPGVALAELGRMVRALGEAVKSPDVGRRRVGPKKLAAQLAEMRRRAGRSTPCRPSSAKPIPGPQSPRPERPVDTVSSLRATGSTSPPTAADPTGVNMPLDTVSSRGE